MNDRFKFRAWWKPNYREPIMLYDVEKTYDFMRGKPESICADCFGEVLEDKDYIVMQCTGMKDKNGKLIYEGDIVRFTEYEIDEVEPEWEYTTIVWGGDHDYPAFDLKTHEFDCNGLSEIFNVGYTIEVCGNIYENAEKIREVLDEK